MKYQDLSVVDKDIAGFLTKRYLDQVLTGVFPDASPIADEIHEQFNLPALGAHLVTPRLGYTHHGVYIGDKKVIHYSGLADGLNAGPVEETSLQQFQGGKGYTVQPHPNASYSPGEIVRRAYSRLAETSYNLVFNNCEHFAHWCVYNTSASQQVNAAIKTTAVTALKAAGKSNPAFKGLVALNDIKHSIKGYIKGDIDRDKLFEDISHTALTTSAMSYYGVLGQAAIPIPGAGFLVGAGIGYFIGNTLQQSGLLALGDTPELRAAKKRRQEIEALCNRLIPEIRKSRAQLESYLENHFSDRQMAFRQAFNTLDDSLRAWDTEKFSSALEQINSQFGQTLKFKTFEEFDEFMLSDETLTF